MKMFGRCKEAGPAQICVVAHPRDPKPDPAPSFGGRPSCGIVIPVDLLFKQKS